MPASLATPALVTNDERAADERAALASDRHPPQMLSTSGAQALPPTSISPVESNARN
jgi:hypothetical protein